ncbi:MAG: hypothetical protein K0Q69_1047 [Devosia sp.]|jgi:hypothetical protein|nr:hypothetical protein [Devosia sp.]RYE48606.1 MAG: DUF1223 domain-containing protein [Hyphomicrobiales bacterium]
MLSRSILCGVSLSLALISTALAGEIKLAPKAVLELFTSQGCKSCPKADAMLDEMGKRPDVVALAYHVDYWDYIGWEDTFGAKENSDRQRDYAESWGSSRIFTPQLVVNGKGGLVGSKRDAVNGALGSASLPLDVKLSEAPDDMLQVSVPAKAGEPDAMIWLVTFLDRADVTIERGENEGKQVAYTQIVTGRQVLGMWKADAGAELTLPLAEVLTGRSNGAAILIQQDRDGLPGPIVGAASFTR